MKISKVAIAITSLLVCSNVYATTVLKVWEDVQKSHGIAQAVADFEALNDCKVVVEEVPFISQVDRLRLEGPSGDGPDVLMIPADRVGAATVQGLIAPIKFMQEDQDKYIRSAVSAFAQGGEIYAVPKVVETLVLFYNKDILKQPYDTLNEYYDYAMKKKATSDDEYGFIAKWDSFYYAYGVMQPYGAYVFGTDSDGNLDSRDVGLANEGAIKSVELIKKFLKQAVFLIL